MASIILNREGLRFNYDYLRDLFAEHDIDWAIVAKLLCGNKQYLSELIKLGHKEICDSRLSNLKVIKSLDPDLTTIYIKPPAKRLAAKIVQHADVSFNTTLSTVKALSKAAVAQNKIHSIIIMMELGELREGIMRKHVSDFYRETSALPNIKVLGLGANLACLNGILPSREKMDILVSQKKKLEEEFNCKIPYLSGGASVTIPLIFREELPKSINHFRVGESLFFGTNVYNDGLLKNMRQDVFLVKAQILELKEKPSLPSGIRGTNLEGKTVDVESQKDAGDSKRALVDLGLLDVDSHHITPVDSSLNILGASSDMTVLDLGDNPQQYKVGDYIYFQPDYMGVLRLMSSSYIDKELV